jgi:hypothetical protein
VRCSIWNSSISTADFEEFLQEKVNAVDDDCSLSKTVLQERALGDLQIENGDRQGNVYFPQVSSISERGQKERAKEAEGESDQLQENETRSEGEMEEARSERERGGGARSERERNEEARRDRERDEEARKERERDEEARRERELVEEARVSEVERLKIQERERRRREDLLAARFKAEAERALQQAREASKRPTSTAVIAEARHTGGGNTPAKTKRTAGPPKEKLRVGKGANGEEGTSGGGVRSGEDDEDVQRQKLLLQILAKGRAAQSSGGGAGDTPMPRGAGDTPMPPTPLPSPSRGAMPSGKSASPLKDTTGAGSSTPVTPHKGQKGFSHIGPPNQGATERSISPIIGPVADTRVSTIAEATQVANVPQSDVSASQDASKANDSLSQSLKLGEAQRESIAREYADAQKGLDATDAVNYAKRHSRCVQNNECVYLYLHV